MLIGYEVRGLRSTRNCYAFACNDVKGVQA